MALRQEIARAAGWDELREYIGYDGTRPYPSDPVAILLGHSDCEGEIPLADCGLLADRLEDLLPNLPHENAYMSPRAEARRFIQGLRRAILAGEAVVFW